MKITNIKYDIVSEENDYSAESRAQKMREMANELRAQRDKAQEVYVPATQEIGWKKVQVFFDNIETQIKPLLYALKEIKEADGSPCTLWLNVFTPNRPITLWELRADSDGKIEIKARPKKDDYCKDFPSYWVKENGEPKGVISEEDFYGDKGLIANTDFSEVLKAIDEKIVEEYNAQLDKIRFKHAYYENSFKKMAHTDKDVNLDALIRSAEKRATQGIEKGTAIEKDMTIGY